MKREGKVKRETGETFVQAELNLDGRGEFKGSSGAPFLDHMLSLFCRNANLDLNLEARGDLEVDSHHTVEDVGITLGLALKEALGGKEGIARYGWAALPMDEALVLVSLDLSGRAHLGCELPLPAERLGGLESELVEDFLRALAFNAGFTLHVRLLSGRNSHHMVEAAFKGLGRALRQAAAFDPAAGGVPSTKGTLV